MRKIGLIVLFLCVGLEVRASVWEATNEWNAEAENQFSQWIAKVPLNIFTDSRSRWRGISTDCADAAYALRIIFAAKNALPVEFTGEAGKKLSNTNADFDEVTTDGDQRLRRFIRLVSQFTNTRTIVADTYPVEINRRYVRPGTLFVHPEGGPKIHITFRPGHVYYLRKVADNGMITYVSSTVPAMVRDLSPRFGISFAPFYRSSGYRVWKWPRTSLRPGHSEEQFRLANWRPNAFTDDALAVAWQQAIVDRLATRPMTSAEKVSAAAQNVVSGVRDRALIVRRGWQIYTSKYRGQGCMTKADYDAYSTPTRDVKIQIEIENLEGLVGGRVAEVNTRVDIWPGHEVSIADLRTAFLSRRALAISEPEHSPNVRWGFAGQGEWPCPSRRKAYRGADE